MTPEELDLIRARRAWARVTIAAGVILLAVLLASLATPSFANGGCDQDSGDCDPPPVCDQDNCGGDVDDRDPPDQDPVDPPEPEPEPRFCNGRAACGGGG